MMMLCKLRVFILQTPVRRRIIITVSIIVRIVIIVIITIIIVLIVIIIILTSIIVVIVILVIDIVIIAIMIITPSPSLTRPRSRVSPALRCPTGRSPRRASACRLRTSKCHMYTYIYIYMYTHIYIDVYTYMALNQNVEIFNQLVKCIKNCPRRASASRLRHGVR